MAFPLVFPDATTRNQAYSIFWLSKRPRKWPFRWFSRTLRHGIGPTACSGSPSVRGNGPSAGFCGRYDTKSGLQHILAVQASFEMAIPLISRTLRHGISPTAYSGCHSVRGNGSSAGFRGHFDTKSRLQHVLAAQASTKMAIPLVFPDATTRNRPHSVFWQPKCPKNRF